MRVLTLSQKDDREAWLEARRGLITGSKAKMVKPLSRGTDRTPSGFWFLLAEKLSITRDGETDMERGNRLEPEAVRKTAELYNLDINDDCGMWVSDENEAIAVSPDAAENSDKPTYAIEAKCLSSPMHLKYMVTDLLARDKEDYRPFDYIPSTSQHSYQEQVLQYFVVNPDLKRLYFTLYDDRMAFEHLIHHVITIDRDDIEEEIEQQAQMQRDVIERINKLMRELVNEQA